MMKAEVSEKDPAVRTKKFALRIMRLVEALPRSQIAKILGNQILRSGTSIGAIYREARRARRKAEFIAKAGDCLNEADETAYWLELLAEGKAVPAGKLLDIQDETSQLIAVFVTTLKSSKSNPS